MPPLTVAQFAATLRRQYPTESVNLPDDKLVAYYVEANPSLASSVDPKELAQAKNRLTASRIEGQEFRYKTRDEGTPEARLLSPEQRRVASTSPVTRAVEPVLNMLEGAINLPVESISEAKIRQATHPDASMLPVEILRAVSRKMVTEPSEGLEREAIVRGSEGNPREAQALTTAAHVPILGPAIASIAQKAGIGNVAGAAGESALLAYPELKYRVGALRPLGGSFEVLANKALGPAEVEIGGVKYPALRSEVQGNVPSGPAAVLTNLFKRIGIGEEEFQSLLERQQKATKDVMNKGARKASSIPVRGPFSDNPAEEFRASQEATRNHASILYKDLDKAVAAVPSAGETVIRNITPTLEKFLKDLPVNEATFEGGDVLAAVRNKFSDLAKAKTAREFRTTSDVSTEGVREGTSSTGFKRNLEADVMSQVENIGGGRKHIESEAEGSTSRQARTEAENRAQSTREGRSQGTSLTTKTPVESVKAPFQTVLDLRGKLKDAADRAKRAGNNNVARQIYDAMHNVDGSIESTLRGISPALYRQWRQANSLWSKQVALGDIAAAVDSFTKGTPVDVQKGLAKQGVEARPTEINASSAVNKLNDLATSEAYQKSVLEKAFGDTPAGRRQASDIRRVMEMLSRAQEIPVGKGFFTNVRSYGIIGTITKHLGGATIGRAMTTPAGANFVLRAFLDESPAKLPLYERIIKQYAQEAGTAAAITAGERKHQQSRSVPFIPPKQIIPVEQGASQ